MGKLTSFIKSIFSLRARIDNKEFMRNFILITLVTIVLVVIFMLTHNAKVGLVDYLINHYKDHQSLVKMSPEKPLLYEHYMLHSTYLLVVYLILRLILAYTSIVQISKRLHDLNKGLLHSLFYFIPIYGIIWIIRLMFLKSEDTNQEKIIKEAAWKLILILLIQMIFSFLLAKLYIWYSYPT